MDNGCDNHITEDRKVSVSNVAISFASKFKVGNGKHVAIKDEEIIGVTTK